MFNLKQVIKDMDLNGNPADHRIVVAMSGGVDSSVTAALLVEAGFDVVGLTMQLYDHGKALKKKGACCAGSDINDARLVADKLQIPHYVLNYENIFQDKVMEDFADSYLRGETPIPCVRCNQTVKFTDMFERAKRLGASAMATGHYIRRKNKSGMPSLYKGIDDLKDQSYFLFATTKKQLDFLRFPLGSLTKEETRSVARKHNLNVSEKPDSQDICFVPEGNYADIVRKLRPGSIDAGNIIDVDGKVLGKHNGIIDYTIGQRKGIGIGGRKGIADEETVLYVIALDSKNNNVIVGPRKLLACKKIKITECNWIIDQPKKSKFRVLVKLRNSSKPVDAEVVVNFKTGLSNLYFDEPQFGVSTGQAAVFYNTEEFSHVLGGGWISEAPNMASLAQH
ncbi:tRNA 2-thiouridine(34) synthase MnmA [Alphaproteobacteria bacterium]|nr:tRNA 2-thiouridine(34) synthase MnmA [Alphaproteobacteria bacterium]